MIIRQIMRTALAFCALGAFTGTAVAQINGTPHDLGSGLTGAGTDNNEVCVYCHTPHGARTDIEAPLWNKPAGSATYQTYDSTTIDGEVLTVGSVSIACLTCHDGTQARDAVINAPGSGIGSGFARGGTVTDIGPISANIANLGEDLRNEHPIGIQYGGFDPGTGQIDAVFKNDTSGLASSGTGALQRWWVDTEATPDATRQKTDMILYSRLNGGNTQPFVECASCHDPHVGNAGANGLNFMRISNADSAVCLACHTK